MWSMNALRAALEAGVSHHRAGRPVQAEKAYRAVLKQSPGQPDALHLLGVLATEAGDPVRGAEMIRRALVAMPTNADAHSNLGNALRASGQLLDATRSYRRAIKLQPGHVAAHVNLGVTFSGLSDHPHAVASFTKALTLDANNFEARQGLARSHRAVGELAQAEAAYLGALALRSSVELVIELAAVLVDVDRPEEALALVGQAQATHPGDAGLIRVRAQCEYRLGDIGAAVASHRCALALDLAAAPAWNDLGRALRAQGDQEAAELAFRRASTLDPHLVDARRNLALISPTSSEQIEPLEALLARPGLPDADAMLAGFALGKLLDDQGRYDEAFAHFARANALALEINAAQGRRFDADALRRRVDDLIRAPVRPPKAEIATNSDLPVFIVGMPRSGTSLVEQIAASHSDVHGAGELRAIGRIASRLAAETDRPAALAQAHLATLRRLGGEASRVIDKMPDNAFHLGLIERLFPQARVIICEREARDTCVSNYFQLYTSGNLFSYDLAHCAERQIQTSRILFHWCNHLSLRTLNVSYELLVRDLEQQSRRIIDFLGLPWQPACLDFQKTSRVVRTASAWQVRQPLYTYAIGRWRNYEKYLGPLEPIRRELVGADASGAPRRLDAWETSP